MGCFRILTFSGDQNVIKLVGFNLSSDPSVFEYFISVPFKFTAKFIKVVLFKVNGKSCFTMFLQFIWSLSWD